MFVLFDKGKCFYGVAELDKLLEDTPLPLGAQHAAKLSGIRKRVGSLTETLRIIQGRINSMDRMLSKEKSVGSLH